MTGSNTHPNLFRAEVRDSKGYHSPSPRTYVRQGGILVILILCLIVAFSLLVVFFVEYARTVSVSGAIDTAAGTLRVTAHHQGEISAIYVQAGDHVRAGQVVAQINYDSENTQGQSTESLLLSAARSEETDLKSQIEATSHEAIAEDSVNDLKRHDVLQQAAHASETIAMESARVGSLTRTANTFEELSKTQVVSEVQARERQEELYQAKESREELKKARDSLLNQADQLTDERSRERQHAQEAIFNLKTTLDQVKAKEVTYSSEAAASLVAPAPGLVSSVGVNSGDSILDNATVVSIVPDRVKLEAILWIPSRAIGFTKPGMPVRLMYDSFPYERFGIGKANLVEVDKAPMSPNDLPAGVLSKEPLYRGIAVIQSSVIHAYGKDWPIQPGMRFNADILLAPRSLFDWLIEPLEAAQARKT